MSAKGTSFFRLAGLSYLQYVNKSANVLREALKEPVKSKVLHRNNVEFAAFKWVEGERGQRVDISSIKKAAEAFQKA
ncbi:hypothetical protein P43SY_010609 [Pythium insidiosum]|uniref:H-or Na-translocating F-type, V-type and A-type ATPase (F-ATPase) Superfamily n=1 Tax=Pythium insidiosum TaxID=114742 RepID=A0AAD5Q3L2_PYTIN|nr:hypothetical protein P43SY_010609 [Pythium insidiosum]KAJ0397551.1 hypothetical protein ATCC90586_007729 [Pythium insidiosum]